MLDPARFQTLINGKKTALYHLQSEHGIRIAVTNFGARIVAIEAPDRNARMTDIALGFDNIDAYIHPTGERFLGATIGRCGNRLAGGSFSLDAQTYALAKNNGTNCLHGGVQGFDNVVWDVLFHNAHTIEFFYASPDGEEGFPGNLKVFMTYTLRNDALMITHRAVTDKRTIVNLTHHSFFNLKGEGQGDINDHILRINASRYDPIDANMIPETPSGASVEGTPMDFRMRTQIGARLKEPFEQLIRARGYDHNWILDRQTPDMLEWAATVYEPQSGRLLEVHTTEPAMQFYGGNWFDGKSIGKSGVAYGPHCAFALETQHYPDAIHRPETPSVVLEPNRPYFHGCLYRFSAQ